MKGSWEKLAADETIEYGYDFWQVGLLSGLLCCSWEERPIKCKAAGGGPWQNCRVHGRRRSEALPAACCLVAYPANLLN